MRFQLRERKKNVQRHSSLPWDIMFKLACVRVCVSAADKAQSGPLCQITASLLAEQTTWRIDPRYEALYLGWSLVSPAHPGSSDCPPCQSRPASTQGETLLHRCCWDRLELHWQWHKQVGYWLENLWLETTRIKYAAGVEDLIHYEVPTIFGDFIIL